VSRIVHARGSAGSRTNAKGAIIVDAMLRTCAPAHTLSMCAHDVNVDA
jgi:hypothetical protein